MIRLKRDHSRSVVINHLIGLHCSYFLRKQEWMVQGMLISTVRWDKLIIARFHRRSRKRTSKNRISSNSGTKAKYQDWLRREKLVELPRNRPKVCPSNHRKPLSGSNIEWEIGDGKLEERKEERDCRRMEIFMNYRCVGIISMAREPRIIRIILLLCRCINFFKGIGGICSLALRTVSLVVWNINN